MEICASFPFTRGKKENATLFIVKICCLKDESNFAVQLRVLETSKPVESQGCDPSFPAQERKHCDRNVADITSALCTGFSLCLSKCAHCLSFTYDISALNFG